MPGEEPDERSMRASTEYGDEAQCKMSPLEVGEGFSKQTLVLAPLAYPGLLTDAIAEVVEACLADAAATKHFNALEVGTGEGEDALDAETYTRSLIPLLRGADVPTTSVTTDGDHDFANWDAQWPQLLAWLHAPGS